MPELALSFCIGAGVSFIASIIFYFFQIRRYDLAELKMIQQNLKTLDLRWNDLEGRLEKADEKATQAEIKKAKNTYLLFGCGAVGLSWLGLFLLLLMWFSLKKLIKNRLEEYLFTSGISQNTLSPEQMREFRLKLEGLGFDSPVFQAQANNQ